MCARFLYLAMVASALPWRAAAQPKPALFAVPPEFSAGISQTGGGYAGSPYPALTLDLNHDGYDDFVTTTGNAVVVVLGGSHGFLPPTTFPVPGAGAVAAGDFNGDGNPDLIVVGQAVYLLLGTGTGSFQAPTTISTSPAYRVAVGDFNGDGKLDFAVAGGNISNPLQVALGNGDGTFGSFISSPATKFPWGLYPGDFHNQGRDDLILVAGGNAYMLTSNGDGTFQDGPAVLANTWGLVVADMNGDGNQDLVTINSMSSVRVFFGDGAGSFKLGAGTPIESYAGYASVADVNGDGIPDIITANSDDSISVVLGKGAGDLQPSYSYKTNGFPYWMGIGKYFGSDRADVVVLAAGGDRIPAPVLIVLRNDGTGHYGLRNVPYLYGNGFALADMNQDGNLDLVVTDPGDSSFSPSSVSVLPGTGKGNFGKAISIVPMPQGASSPAVADFNGDGRPDFAVSTSGGIVVGLQQAGNTYQVLLGAGPSGSIFFAGDLNGDGSADLLVQAGSTIWVFLGNGDGTFQPAQPISYPGLNAAYPAVADFNNDGIPDIAVAGAVLLGNGNGTFQQPFELNLPNQAYGLSVGDFNNDGNQDIMIVVQGGPAGILVFLGDGKGRFQALPIQPYQALPSQTLTADLNGDGNLDALFNSFGVIQIYLGDGHGRLTFEGITYSPSTAGSTTEAATRDVNNDGKTDFVCLSGAFSIFLNTSKH